MNEVQARRWQAEFLAAWTAHEDQGFLTVACPGAGKTTAACLAARRYLETRPRAVLGVVAPTAHLRLQWRRAAHRLGIQLATEIPARGRLDRAYHGLALTYAQLLVYAERVRELIGEGMAIPDEIHHAGHAKAWGDAVHHAFERTEHVLGLSGTPFRSDQCPIPFVRYDEDGASIADYSYGYAEALRDRVVRPVYFVPVGGRAEWSMDGERRAARFDEVVPRDWASQRLRTALMADGGWISGVFGKADRWLRQVRAGGHADAGGLVLCLNRAHARAVSRRIQELTGRTPAVALSDDPRASEVISAFGAGREPWLVAVGMVSEGVDLVRLRVLVVASSVSSELWWRQSVGRVVRMVPGLGEQDARVYFPADPTFMENAKRMAEERRHQVELRSAETEMRAPGEAGFEEEEAAIGPVADSADGGAGDDAAEGEAGDRPVVLRFQPLRSEAAESEMVLAAAADLGLPDLAAVPVEERRELLREKLHEEVGHYARVSGHHPREVNRLLVERSGKPVAELDESGLLRQIQRVEKMIRLKRGGRAPARS